MAHLSLEERLNQIEDKISRSPSERTKDLEMKSDIMYSIMIRERNWKYAATSHI